MEFTKTVCYWNELKLDIFSNTSFSMKPVVVCVHGGGFISGNRSLMHSIASEMRKSGMVAVCPQYRLSQPDKIEWRNLILILSIACLMYRLTSSLSLFIVAICFLILKLLTMVVLNTIVKHPDHVNDVARAISYVVNNSKSFGVDPNKVFLLGHSAGAGIVGLISLNNQYLKNVGMTRSILKGTVLLSPITSQFALSTNIIVKKTIDTMIHPRTVTQEAYSNSFSITSIMPSDLQTPPMLVVTGAIEASIHDHALDFIMSMHDAGNTISYYQSKKNNHISIRKNWQSSNRVVSENVVRFLTTCLGD